MIGPSNQPYKKEDVSQMTKVLKEEWKYPDTSAEERYADQSLAASKGQKVTHDQSAPAQQGPVPIPVF